MAFQAFKGLNVQTNSDKNLPIPPLDSEAISPQVCALDFSFFTTLEFVYYPRVMLLLWKVLTALGFTTLAS